MIPISYAITAHNEHIELDALLSLLTKNLREVDEIVLQLDTSATNEVRLIADRFRSEFRNYNVIFYALNGDFASFKNNLKKHCTRPWIFQLDADELLHPDFIQALPGILNDNPTVELLCVPRINTVKGLTDEHIKRWGWRVDANGWVNFPDIQTRIIQNNPKIKWANKVHEVVVGHSSHAVLPLDDVYCILHHKHIARQEAQNDFYNSI
jgi:cellulose synthase/poly-beta-1,6-N-acetylglucosamine synthase-like glycosyltransferase